ncbi:unnamed protein product [Arctia plantaginis]|uniref:Uncharacterized protein n=1 Tax=Arctia plantaginis TaxID=874455 RepID=A0A8S1ANK5_ARCPL|nr:unnamed protein product [Arctia plantaginis]
MRRGFISMLECRKMPLPLLNLIKSKYSAERWMTDYNTNGTLFVCFSYPLQVARNFLAADLGLGDRQRKNSIRTNWLSVFKSDGLVTKALLNRPMPRKVLRLFRLT